MTPRFPSDFWHLRGDRPAVPPAGIVPPPSFLSMSFEPAWPSDAVGLDGALDGVAVPGELSGFEELFDTEDGPCRCTVDTLHPRRRPCSLFVPEKYERMYPYPLVLWLHGQGGTEFDLFKAMPGISARNYLGLGLRGPVTLPGGGYDWSPSDEGIEKLASDIYETVGKLRRAMHVHSERVILAGFDTGATAALELLVRRPDWFGGAVAIGGTLPSPQPVTNAGDDEPKRVLLITGDRQDARQAGGVLQAARRLRSTPLSVSIAIEPGGHEITRPMLRRIDHWIMDGICTRV